MTSRPLVSSEYEVISTAKGPDGEQVSILTTNQTHTAVENLKPESRYPPHSCPNTLRLSVTLTEVLTSSETPAST